MPAKSRLLTTDDVARLVALATSEPDRHKIYKAVEAVAAETCGWVLLTTLRYDEAKQVVVRLHSSDETAYPVGGTKPLDKLTVSHGTMATGDVFLAGDKEEVKKAYFDYELIFSLGITAILNAPIRHAGRRLGTLNFCGVAGTYGPEEVKAAKILAGLLAPCLMEEMKG